MLVSLNLFNIFLLVSLPPTFLLPISIAVSMFMCRLCNLFSPSHTRLLAHCSQLHPQQEPPDDIIIALQPLAGEPGETLAGLITILK